MSLLCSERNPAIPFDIAELIRTSQRNNADVGVTGFLISDGDISCKPWKEPVPLSYPWKPARHCSRVLYYVPSSEAVLVEPLLKLFAGLAADNKTLEQRAT
jgi:hypothetical protein